MPQFYIFQFVPILVVEALVMWRLKWGPLKNCFFDSLMINFASMVGLLLGIGPFITGIGPFGLCLFGTYSTLVEGAALMLLERHDVKKVWKAVILANAASCLMLGLERIAAKLMAHVS